MIILPPNVRDWIVVDIQDNRLLLHVQNEHRQFYVSARIIDKAMPLDDQVESFIAMDRSTELAYTVTERMETVMEGAKDQDWKPVAVPLHHDVTLLQYLASREQPSA